MVYLDTSFIFPPVIAEDSSRSVEVRVRAGDAFHLAIAANHGAEKILSLDQGFLKTGRQLKLLVGTG